MPEWMLQLIGLGVLYGSIRSDLKHAKECADQAKNIAGKAHDRIDGMLRAGN